MVLVTSLRQGSYRSYKHFFEATYGHAIAEVRDLSCAGASMLQTQQGAGDCSDAPTPDLVVAIMRRQHATGLCDVGAGRFQMSGRKGTGILVSPNVGTQIYMYGPHECLAMGLPYRRLMELMPERLPRDGDFGAVHTRELDNPFILSLLNELWNEGNAGNLQGALFAQGALTALAATLLRLSSAAPIPSPVRGGLAPWQVRRAKEHIAGLLDQDIRLTDVAAEVGLSPFHFARAFKSSLAMPPYRYQMRLRVEKACELLASTDLPITEIAFRVGYQSSQALARVFAREMGTTPSAWRREKGS